MIAKRSRMQKISKMQIPLLVLGLLSLTLLASAQDGRYEDVVKSFIREYNGNSGTENLFRLSILNLAPGESDDPAAPRSLSFTIAETVCLNAKNRNPDECDFRENGLVKECIGTIALDSTQNSVDISCDGPEKIKRIGLGGLVRRLWDRIRRRG